MSQPVHLEVFYPYPRERVWQVLTDRRALAAWMMENDFEPTLGHKFRFYNRPLQGLMTTIQCEVVELEEPSRLGYTWQESPTAEPSLVIWTLTTVAGGTQLRLKHYQYSGTPAVATSNYPAFYQPSGLFCAEMLPASGLAVAPRSNGQCDPFSPSSLRLQSRLSAGVSIREFSRPHLEWNYFLNHTLPNVLAQDSRIEIADS